MSEKKGIFSFLNFDSIIENFSGYIENRIALFKIELMDQMALGSARLVIYIVLALCIFMTVLFLSIAAAFYLNHILNNNIFGFVIIACFYLVLFILIFFIRSKKIENRLKNAILNMLNSLEDKDGNDN